MDGKFTAFIEAAAAWCRESKKEVQGDVVVHQLVYTPPRRAAPARHCVMAAIDSSDLTHQLAGWLAGWSNTYRAL